MWTVTVNGEPFGRYEQQWLAATWATILWLSLPFCKIETRPTR